jgi:hypothetical protein
MTIDEVLKLRETTVFDVWFSASAFQIIVFTIVVLILGGMITEITAMILNAKSITYSYPDPESGKAKVNVEWNTISVVIGYIPLLVLTTFVFASCVNASGWEKNYARPYFQSLPTQKVTNIDIISIAPTDDSGQFIVTYSVKSDVSVASKTVVSKIKRTLNDNDSLYLSYVYLEKELPKVEEAGKHNVVLYVPKNYSLGS